MTRSQDHMTYVPGPPGGPARFIPPPGPAPMRVATLLRAPALVAAALVLLGACADTGRESAGDLTGPVSAPVAPSASRTAALVPACERATNREIGTALAALFTNGAERKAAQTHLRDIAAVCDTDIALARTRMFELLRFALDRLAPNTQADGTLPALVTLAGLVNDLFVYVGYADPGLTGPTFSTAGRVRLLVDAAVGGDLITPDKQALLRVPAGATEGTRLFTITPIVARCLPTNLEQIGGCYDIDVNPAVVPGFARDLTVAICTDEALPAEKLAVGHERVAGTTELLQRAVLGPVTGYCDAPHGGTAALAPDAGPLERLTHRALDLVDRVAAVVGPRPLYAIHAGVTGVTRGLSPFGTVNRDLFLASFDAVALGPITTATRPEKGSWSTASVERPGSITVEAPSGALATRHALLNQAGGNCALCGALQLTGRMAAEKPGEVADEGVYEAEWTLVQDKPSVKAAPFRLLDGQRRPIAQLSYRTTSSAREVLYNGVPVTTWSVGQPLRFRVTVDFATRTTALALIDRSTGLPTTLRSGDAFATATAADLAFVEASLSGIDAGIFRWDSIRIKRLDDPTSGN